MPTKNLKNARTVAAIKPPKRGQVDYWDRNLKGFVLRVSAGGKMAWGVIYRNTEGRRRRLTLGAYPSMKVADAHRKAIDELGRISKGADPAAEKKAERKAGTFNELADLYLEIYAKGEKYARWERDGAEGPAPEPNKRSWKNDRVIIDYDLKPAWGPRKAKAITREDVNRILSQIVERGSPIQANRTLGIVRKMYSWAIGTSRVAMNVNPCHEVKKPAKERAGDRVLDASEIKTFWPMAGDDVTITDPLRIALRLILATAQRPGEVTGLPWAELDGDWRTAEKPFWTIPGERTKNRLSHRVPLSPLAVSLLKQAKKLSKASEYAFPSPRPGKSILGTSLSHALIRSGHFKVKHFSPHDLRRSASTHMTGPHCKVSRFILERVLNHADQSVTGRHYDLYEYDDEKRHALNSWAARLAQVIEGKEPDSKVVPIHG
ncbi:MAG: tyrosine-type recombinase/integrase [Proteobacteria bacterium]|nr:tyrosine-type recombinase/integrase [Pseudomonadota bacterium]